jgi:N-formylmaleamate deformylase
MAEWQTGNVIANGIRVHYYRTGGDKPPLVLNHGATDDGLCWTRVARALEADYDIIMPDARGHGLSEAPESGYSSKERAADLAGLIQALRLDKPAVGGHSMGAATTFRLAADYPDIVRCAILEDPGFRSANASADESRQARMRQTFAELTSLSREALIERCRTQSPTWDEVELGPWADSKLRVSSKFLDNMRFRTEPPWQEVLPRIACPVLLITSDPDKGGIVSPEAAEEAVKLNPRVEAVRLRGAGHNIRREQFEGFLEAVRAFLARV